MQQNIDVRALFDLSYGLYIVATEWEGQLNGQIVNTVIQLTGDPIHLAVCLHKSNLTTELLEKNKKFSVSVLSEDVPMPFIGNFGFRCGRDHDKYANCKYEIGSLGVPLVTEYIVADAELELTNVVDVATHKLFIGELKNARKLSDRPPLTYANYHLLKKGKSPANAPTSIFNALK